MKKTFTFLIILMVIGATFHKSLVFAFYELNKEYVIEKLCVNTDKPEMHCDGKCFLSEQTNDDEVKTEGIIINVLKNIKEDVFLTEYNQVLFFGSDLPTIKFSPYSGKSNTVFYNSIFRPPIA